MTRNISVMGIYPDPRTVSDAVSVLRKAAFRATDIAVLSSENEGSKDFAHERHTKAPAGAAAGAAGGALIGAALAWFISMQGPAITGLEPLVAAGPVLAALAGSGAGGALGWIFGYSVGLRMTEYVAKRYAGRIRHGGILLSVHCDTQSWVDRAKKTLRDTGARHISSASEASADYATTDRPTERAPGAVIDRELPVQRGEEAEYVSHDVRKQDLP